MEHHAFSLYGNRWNHSAKQCEPLWKPCSTLKTCHFLLRHAFRLLQQIAPHTNFTGFSFKITKNSSFIQNNSIPFKKRFHTKMINDVPFHSLPLQFYDSPYHCHLLKAMPQQFHFHSSLRNICSASDAKHSKTKSEKDSKQTKIKKLLYFV